MWYGFRKNKEGKERKKEKEKEHIELTWFSFRGLHPQRKALNCYIFIIKLFVYYNEPIDGYI